MLSALLVSAAFAAPLEGQVEAMAVTMPYHVPIEDCFPCVRDQQYGVAGGFDLKVGERVLLGFHAYWADGRGITDHTLSGFDFELGLDLGDEDSVVQVRWKPALTWWEDHDMSELLEAPFIRGEVRLGTRRWQHIFGGGVSSSPRDHRRLYYGQAWLGDGIRVEGGLALAARASLDDDLPKRALAGYGELGVDLFEGFGVKANVMLGGIVAINLGVTWRFAVD